MAAPRRLLVREILALALCAVVFLAAVVASRLQGTMLAGGTAAIGTLCLPGGESPDLPDQQNGQNRHCAICAVVATDCGSPQFEAPVRRALIARHGVNRTQTPPDLTSNAYEARGPPAQA